MSTIPRRVTDDTMLSPDDPYFYGFRNVTRRTKNGKTVLVTVPLTEHDVLHPQEGDHITQNDAHDIDRTYLRDVFTVRAARLPHPKVLSDCSINLGIKGLKAVGSDIAVFSNVRQQKFWSSFSVRKEKAKWVLVGEVTSPSTRNNDLNRKLKLYYKAGIPLYFIVDQEAVRDEVRQLRLIGYERGRSGYREMSLSADGRLWLEPLQLWLGAEGGRVVCYDAEGIEIEDYAGLEEASREAEAAREIAEAERKEAEEALRVAEAVRNAAEEARNAAEAARNAAEAEKRAAEERARQLEEELRRLRGR